MCAQRTVFCGYLGMRTARLETGRDSQSLRHFSLLIMSELRSQRLTMSKADKAELHVIQLQALEYLEKSPA
jgi:hypothetical protein